MDRAAFELLLSDWLSAPRGGKTAIIERAAQVYGISAATLYRRLSAAGHAGPERTREPKRPELRDWTRTLMMLATKTPGRSIPMDLCLTAAVREGLLPPEAGEIHIGTYNRIAVELGLRQGVRRTRRLSAEFPMQAVQFDASTSKHLIVVKSIENNDDYLLRLFRDPMPASGYKNKPLGPERLRVIYYGQWDMATGLRHMAATCAQGEAGIAAMEYLVDSWKGSADPRQPFKGLPMDLWSDQGPITKHRSTADLLDRLNVNLEKGEAYQKTRQGGIEGGWSTTWNRFEASLFLLQAGKLKVELTLSELNVQLAEYLAELNSRPSRRERALSRIDAYIKGVNRQGGIRQCPENAMETLAQEVRRTLDSSGIFSWNNVEYEVPRLHACQVIARRSLENPDRVTVESLKTGERYEARRFVPLPYGQFDAGEKGFGSPKLPIDELKAKGGEIAISTPFYGQKPTESPTNIRQFPQRSKPAEPLSDPLDAGRHATLAECWGHFTALYPYPLNPGNRALIEQRFVNSNFRKSAVTELALALISTVHSANTTL